VNKVRTGQRPSMEFRDRSRKLSDRPTEFTSALDEIKDRLRHIMLEIRGEGIQYVTHFL